jgi:hypothetical protein
MFSPIRSFPLVLGLLMVSPHWARCQTKIGYSVFQAAPPEFGGVRWVSFNLSGINEQNVIESVRRAAQSGSAGSFEIGPTRGPTTGLSEAYLRGSGRKPDDAGVPYLSDEYFRLYKIAMDEGRRNNFPLSVLYD